ncbi:hypothetical protein OG936_38925 (plasmid) [Streptomyces sp. NBC_00846]|uniref:hypothetical protein n=1 Tax=Streptomyces sp. NBC_00846 TaxID=2975849 RepID=UPI002F919664|nr:hypothetical protein OG936_38925 [Streptomyces sp. NBC_00846]
MTHQSGGALAVRLQHLRKDAGLTGKELSARCGRHPAKTTRIQKVDAVQRTVWPLEAFYLHDDTQAVVETLTAEIKVKQPRELADCAKAFTGLAEMAVYDDAARTLIQAAIDALE